MDQALAGLVISFMQENMVDKLDKFERNMQEWQHELKYEPEDFFKIPIPEGAIHEGKNILVREDLFTAHPIFGLLKADFKKTAFTALMAVIGQEPQEENWKKKVVEKTNRESMKDWSQYAFVPLANEIWLATPSHPKDIMDEWQGPWSLNAGDGMSFQWNLSGTYLQPAFTTKFEY